MLKRRVRTSSRPASGGSCAACTLVRDVEVKEDDDDGVTSVLVEGMVVSVEVRVLAVVPSNVDEIVLLELL